MIVTSGPSILFRMIAAPGKMIFSKYVPGDTRTVPPPSSAASSISSWMKLNGFC
jgi:hypothetical protein